MKLFLQITVVAQFLLACAAVYALFNYPTQLVHYIVDGEVLARELVKPVYNNGDQISPGFELLMLMPVLAAVSAFIMFTWIAIARFRK